MLSELDLRQEIVKLLREHQAQISNYDKEAAERKQRLLYRHFRKLESIEEEGSFLSKALQIRRQHLQMQRYKLRIQRKRTELIFKQAIELNALKMRWREAQIKG
ncbi:hypothetical protein DYBT9623_00782 [Dyadobacter sp. CECT 9623]|uniref:Uncharacterized protein n=1 Tax=Dyadobacter linearis TaxID=2823330 RepID=A0ABM8UL88_9BACT|nr:hypothetical protein [Dyadobacter sp. CECT 9623]CAG5068054.1 hypothetical protein DYBT9623_00782 [Dyadobacter sp. CECT 9623]